MKPKMRVWKKQVDHSKEIKVYWCNECQEEIYCTLNEWKEHGERHEAEHKWQMK